MVGPGASAAATTETGSAKSTEHSFSKDCNRLHPSWLCSSRSVRSSGNSNDVRCKRAARKWRSATRSLSERPLRAIMIAS
eukprot:88111-Alexandrium_andersonii.AAC.1